LQKTKQKKPVHPKANNMAELKSHTFRECCISQATAIRMNENAFSAVVIDLLV